LVACGSPGSDRASGEGLESPLPRSEVYRVERVADDIYATVVQDGISPSRFAASLIVIRDDHVVVVDSRHDDESAQELIDTIAALTALPVGYVVNTHWHGDHVQGNARFREVFPEVRFVAGATVAEDLMSLGRQRLDEEVARVDARAEAAGGWLAAGAGPDGTALTAEEIEALPGQIAAARAYADERRSLELVPPTIVVENRFELVEGDPTIEIIRVGPAHTRGDVVVYLPDHGVLALGDLIEDGFPWFGDGFPRGWADAMDRIVDIPGTVLLGAHGPVLRDREALETQRRFTRRIAETAAAAVTAGVGLEQAMSGGEFEEFQTRYTIRMTDATEAERTERFAAFVREVLTRAVAEAAGDLEETR